MYTLLLRTYFYQTIFSTFKQTLFPSKNQMWVLFYGPTKSNGILLYGIFGNFMEQVNDLRNEDTN